jgi:hypothetical protein
VSRRRCSQCGNLDLQADGNSHVCTNPASLARGVPAPAADPRLFKPEPVKADDDLAIDITISPEEWNKLSSERKEEMREAGWREDFVWPPELQIKPDASLWNALRTTFLRIKTTDDHWTCGKLATAAIELLQKRGIVPIE